MTPLNRSFAHLRGLGPRRLAHLRDRKIDNWETLSRTLPTLAWGNGLVEQVRYDLARSEQALRDGNIAYFVDLLPTRDHWRILAHFFAHASFFDIETTGLGHDATITMIACHHRGHNHLFVRHENIEEFLDVLAEVSLLVSFNGSSFDVPFVLRRFHIPELPCPHIDLRWVCHHAGLRGGLKAIERHLGFERAEDIAGMDGFMAVILWSRWEEHGDRDALEQLKNYCLADVVGVREVAVKIVSELLL